MELSQVRSGGSFRVPFPGRASEKTPAPTDYEIAVYTNTSDRLWFNVLVGRIEVSADVMRCS
jgi:hypothetical protein